MSYPLEGGGMYFSNRIFAHVARTIGNFREQQRLNPEDLSEHRNHLAIEVSKITHWREYEALEAEASYMDTTWNLEEEVELFFKGYKKNHHFYKFLHYNPEREIAFCKSVVHYHTLTDEKLLDMIFKISV